MLVYRSTCNMKPLRGSFNKIATQTPLVLSNLLSTGSIRRLHWMLMERSHVSLSGFYLTQINSVKPQKCNTHVIFHVIN